MTGGPDREAPGAPPGDAPSDRSGAPQAQGGGGREGRNPERGYLMAAVVVKPLMRTWFRIRLEGEEHVPEAGPVILAGTGRTAAPPGAAMVPARPTATGRTARHRRER